MGHLDQLILDMALILLVSTIVTIFFRKLGLPLVLGYILAGFLISPHFVFLPTIVDTQDISVWADIGVIFLMFGLGLEFSFKKIAEVGHAAVITAVTVMGGMWILGLAVGSLLGFNQINSMFLGAMTALSSTMVIMKTYEEYDLRQEGFAKTVMGTMVIEDIGGIFMMIILSAMAGKESVSGFAVAIQLGEMMLFLVIWLLLGIYLIPTILRKVGPVMNDEMLLIFSIAVCFAMVVIASRIGFSDALGAFMGGSILAGTIRGEKIERLLKPLKDLFGAVFFVSVGMMIVPHVFLGSWRQILLITVMVILGQGVLSTLGILFSGKPLADAVRGGASMVQIGEFSFIIASMGERLGALDDRLFQIIVIVAVATIFVTPFSISHAGGILQLAGRILPQRWQQFLQKYTTERTASRKSDNDWNRYLKRYIINLGLSAAMMEVIYLASTSLLAPRLGTLLHGIAGDIACCALTILVMLLPLGIASNRRSNFFLKLWFSSMANRLPLSLLATLQEVVFAVFLMVTLRWYFAFSWWILALAATGLLAVVVRSDVIRRGSYRVRAAFIANLNEKTRYHRIQQKKDDWFYNKIWAAEMTAGDFKHQRRIADMYESRLFDMRVIKVIRRDRAYLMPAGDFLLEKEDAIHIIGTKDRIEAYQELLRRDNPDFAYTALLPLKDYIRQQDRRHVAPEEQIMCAAIEAGPEEDFTAKTIRESGIRERYNAFIIGIDRRGMPIVVENLLDLVIREGDTIWVIGTSEMAQKLLDDDLLDNA